MIGAVHVKYQFGKAVAQFRDPPQTNYENSLSDLMMGDSGLKSWLVVEIDKLRNVGGEN